MFASPRVIAVDDNPIHLHGLVAGLHRSGVACLPIHYPDDLSLIVPCPDVRIVFADLQLTGPASDHKAQFGILGGLLQESIAPRGPYFIVLWTQYPEQAIELRTFLNRLQNVAKPFEVISLDKAAHLDADGTVQDERKLMGEIVALTKRLPQIAVLFDWERRVLGAAGETVSSLLELASIKTQNQRTAEVGRILSSLAVESVGKEHVEDDRFRAVNEALLPILADRVANLRSTPSDATLWNAAVVSTSIPNSLTAEEAARLNRMVHVDNATPESVERGVVTLLPTRLKQDFLSFVGVDETDAAKKQFRCTDFDSADDRFRWVMVQAQAACDYAQSHPGPLPCYLGLEMPFARRTGSLPAALWRSPALEIDGDSRELRISAGFPISTAPNEFRQNNAIYRLREQILNDLIFHLHSQGARPGKMSFRGT